VKVLLAVFISFMFYGCAGVQKGDYVKYTSDDYLFVDDGFLDQSLNCLELGEMKQGGLHLKYCIGRNYASDLVQGFIFKHTYANERERFIGGRLTFKRKKTYSFDCASETIEGETSGTEYINCMIPRRNFDVYAFIMSSNKDVHGHFRALIGNHQAYDGVIGEEGKKLLRQFYKESENIDSSIWKERSL